MPSKTKELHSRPPLARMQRIHKLLQDGKFPNCSSLAKDIEVSSKTIQRDIEYMRDQLGLPIEYDGARHGYYYDGDVTAFPSIPTTEGEVLALFVAQKALEQYRGTPFEQPLASAFAKLAQTLEDSITVDLAQLTTALSFRHTGVAVTNLGVFQKVNQALIDSRELTFVYKKLNGNRPEKRTVQPYHLASIDGQWYLFAHDLDRKDIRTFVLGRIHEVTAIGKPFEKPKDFSLTERLMGAFSVFRGEGNFRVRIEFDDYSAQLVRERTWHSSQKLREIPGGGIILELQLDSLEEVERWVLSWGSHAKVIAPPALKQRVRNALRDMEDIYKVAPRWLVDLHESAQIRQPDRMLQLVMAIDRGLEAPGQMQLFSQER